MRQRQLPAPLPEFLFDKEITPAQDDPRVFSKRFGCQQIVSWYLATPIRSMQRVKPPLSKMLQRPGERAASTGRIRLRIDRWLGAAGDGHPGAPGIAAVH